MSSASYDPPPPFEHRPVMVERIVELFAHVPAGLYVDATLGGAGHAAAVLQANPGLRLLGIDRDQVALAAAGERLARFADRVELVHSGFDDIENLVRQRTDQGASAVLMDLGVSSPQLDVADRGFSYRAAAPLDMRMDRTQSLSAMEVVNEYAYGELVRLIRDYGEERHAGRVARAIVAARPITTTEQLAGIVASAIPAASRRRGGNPAKRTFQAIRIEVNRELDQLADALEGALGQLMPGGRMAVLSYHSLEDRIVKAAFLNAESGGCECPAGLPCVCGAEPTVRLLRRGGWTASDEEVAANPRARSARLRAVEALREQAS